MTCDWCFILIIWPPALTINYSIELILNNFSLSGKSQQQCGHVDSAYLDTFAGLAAGHRWHPHTCTAHKGQRSRAHWCRRSHVHQQPGHINQIPRVQVNDYTHTELNTKTSGPFSHFLWFSEVEFIVVILLISYAPVENHIIHDSYYMTLQM